MKVEKNDAKCFDLVDEEDRYEHSLIATNDGKEGQDGSSDEILGSSDVDAGLAP